MNIKITSIKTKDENLHPSFFCLLSVDVYQFITSKKGKLLIIIVSSFNYSLEFSFLAVVQVMHAEYDAKTL